MLDRDLNLAPGDSVSQPERGKEDGERQGSAEAGTGSAARGGGSKGATPVTFIRDREKIKQRQRKMLQQK